jgi:hypothetical protein
MFCIGSYFVIPDEVEPSKGRLAVLRASRGPGGATKADIIASVQTKGCVYSITISNESIVAAVNSAVCYLRVTLINAHCHIVRLTSTPSPPPARPILYNLCQHGIITTLSPTSPQLVPVSL